jgi:hypothetical protein
MGDINNSDKPQQDDIRTITIEELKKTVVNTISSGNITVYLSPNPGALYFASRNSYNISKEIAEKVTEFEKNNISLRAIIVLESSDLVNDTTKFLQKADLYTQKQYFSDMFRWGFIEINSQALLMLEDTNKKSLVGNLEDHVVSTIKSICY